jgi:acetyl-CoA carboxylase carboxyltransferase component
MGGEQAAGVLTTIGRSRGQDTTPEATARQHAAVQARYEAETTPWFATARLWDDGVIDPRNSRTVLGLALESTLNAEIGESPVGVLRM